jgi:O-antigen/teichoic acid export membrane protein
MKKELVQLVKHSGIYGLGIVLSKCVGFIMIPIYTRLLTPRDYGILELLDLVIFLSTTFVAMGIYAAVFRFYAAYDSEKDKKEVIASALLYTGGIAFLFALAIIHWAPLLAMLCLGDSSLAPLVRIVGFTFFFSNLTEVPMAYWRAQGRSTLFVCISLAKTLTGAFNLVLFLVILKMGVKGALWANLITNGLWGLVLFSVVLAAIPWRIEKKKLTEMLHYGLPTVAWSLAGFVLTFSDRFFLRYYASLSEVGVYALGYKLASVVSILVTAPFSLAWQWQQFELAKRENAKAVLAKVETYVLMVATLVGLGVSVLAKDLLRIMSPPAFWAAAHVVPLIAVSYLLFNAQYVVISGIYIQRVTSRLAVIAAITAGANLGLNYLLIPRLHIMGAAVATCSTYALQLALCLIAAQNIYRIKYEYRRNAYILGAAVLIYCLSLLPNLGIGASVALNLLLLAVFPATCYVLMEGRERQMIQQWALSASSELRRGWVYARQRAAYKS